MIEEIKEDNNCIVKAFENNPISILHENIDNKKVYYFKATDVGKALNLTNIAVSIQNYDDDEKVIRKAYDLRGCEQDTTFLSSQGVYRLLYNSKKDIAKKFRKWAGAILDDIIFNESQELKRQLEKQQRLLEQKEQLIESQENELEKKEILLKRKEKQLKEMTKKTTIDYIYVAVNEGVNNLAKIGITENIIKRNDNHLSSNPGFKYIFTYQSKNNKLIEACVKNVLSPFVYNKAEWFSVEAKDLVFIVEFFIDMFDRNNGTEDSKNIIDFINRLRARNIVERKLNELIPKELYDDFFKKHIEIDEKPVPQHGFNKKEYKYKCTLLRLQQKLDEWLTENNYKIQIKNNHNNYTTAYKTDIQNYIKTRFNKELDTITIIDKKNNINLTSYLGFTGFRMKCDFEKTFFDDAVYKNFIETHLEKESNSRITTKEILDIFKEWLKKTKTQSNMSIYTNDDFSYVFRQEFTNTIEKYFNVKVSRKVTTKKYHGYVGFIGLKIRE